jgi:hypothetical protein
MHSRKTSDKAKPVMLVSRPSRPAHKNPPQNSQPNFAESAPRKQETIEESANSKRMAIPGAPRRPNLGRHAANCRICSHAQREEIEAAFIAWASPANIAKEYGLGDRSSVYRHAHALGLFRRRRHNVRAALERLIEQAGDVEANARAVVTAVQVYAKINSRGEWIEPDERLDLHYLFSRMTAEEYDAYAKDGTLPTWFQDEIAAAGGRAPQGDDHV